jgi:hypothetical protein
MEEVYIYYFLSYLFYLSVGRQKEGSVQILKILYLFKNLIRVDSNIKSEVRELLPLIEKYVVLRGIKTLYRAYGNIHRLEIEDYKSIFNYTFGLDQHIELKNISLSANLKELVIAFEEIKLTCGESKILFEPYHLVHLCQVTPYSTINRMYNRIIDLKFKTTLNFRIFKQLKLDTVFKDLKGKKVDEELIEHRVKDLVHNSGINFKLLYSAFNFSEGGQLEDKLILAIEFLITDSIFSLHEIIKLVGIYGFTYMVSYSIIANAHHRMAGWCDLFFSYYRNSPSKRRERIQKDLEKLIGADNLQYIGTRFHFEKAREYYYSIQELHREGKTYRNMLEKMFYLNDDFDDAVYHFNAAMERYRINTGEIEKKIQEVKNDLKNSSVFDFNKYLIARSIKC